MCGKTEFDIYKIPRIQEKLYIDAKIRENNIFRVATSTAQAIVQKYDGPTSYRTIVKLT